MKKFIVKAGFWALGKGLMRASKLDSLIKQEVKRLPENFTISLVVFPGQISVSWKKTNNKLKYLGLHDQPNSDLRVIIKSLSAATRMILADLGIAKAYAERRIAIEGNTIHAMILTRMLDRVEAYLFPRFLSKKLLKQVPKFGVREYWNNVLIYLGLLV